MKVIETAVCNMFSVLNPCLFCGLTWVLAPNPSLLPEHQFFRTDRIIDNIVIISIVTIKTIISFIVPFCLNSALSINNCCILGVMSMDIDDSSIKTDSKIKFFIYG